MPTIRPQDTYRVPDDARVVAIDFGNEAFGTDRESLRRWLRNGWAGGDTDPTVVRVGPSDTPHYPVVKLEGLGCIQFIRHDPTGVGVPIYDALTAIWDKGGPMSPPRTIKVNRDDFREFCRPHIANDGKTTEWETDIGAFRVEVDPRLPRGTWSLVEEE